MRETMQDHLKQSDPQDRIGMLSAEHRKLDARLRELEHHLSLSPDEQRERAELKKTKLALKDRIFALERQIHR